MFKRFFVVAILCLGLIGCNDINKNGIDIMSSSKSEEVVKSEYASRFGRLIENTIKNDEYDEPYIDSEVLEEQYNAGDRDRFKDFTEGLSTFRTKDEEINSLHDKLIEVSLDVYNMYNELISLAFEMDNIYAGENISDTQFDRIDEINERHDMLRGMIENQIEHVGNIGGDIVSILGLD